jgi:hypothetical protein
MSLKIIFFFETVGRLEGSRVAFTDILQTPEFIFEETQAQADVLRNVLVIDNLEEKTYIPLKSGKLFNQSSLVYTSRLPGVIEGIPVWNSFLQ